MDAPGGRPLNSTLARLQAFKEGTGPYAPKPPPKDRDTKPQNVTQSPERSRKRRYIQMRQSLRVAEQRLTKARLIAAVLVRMGRGRTEHASTAAFIGRELRKALGAGAAQSTRGQSSDGTSPLGATIQELDRELRDVGSAT